MTDTINLSQRETELVVEELDELLVPSRLQRVFEDSPSRLVFQLRAPGTTYHLLVATEAKDTRIHLVDGKPDQPPHPSPFTMQLRKWLQGAWLEELQISEQDRIVFMTFQAIEPDWEPEDRDESAPRQTVILVVELLGRHPNVLLLDEAERIITTGPGKLLGGRDGAAGSSYQAPPPPPDWAETDQVREVLRDVPPDGSRSEQLADYLARSLHQRRQQQLHRSLQRRLNNRLDRLERRIDHIRDDLERIDDAEEFRRRGELLQSAYGEVDPGAESVTVPDFYRDGMPETEIPLDPSKSLQENIDDYFHEYRRLTAARDKVEERLLDTMELRDKIRRAVETVEQTEEFDQLSQLKSQFEQKRLLPRDDARGRKGAKRDRPLPPYREFEATSGSKILVGRNASANDELTTSVARGRDIWLHARNFPGSHVVLRMRKDDELHSEDLVDAATLAAQFSGGREDTVVEVTYTEAKHVRKPKGSPPGSVTIGGGGSTIAVRVEQDRLDRLFDTEVDFRR